jgi:RHS repeat-associated protein
VSLSEHGTYTYQYDELYRLTSADNPTIPGEAYTYGALGNRLSSVATTGVWSYNANNELTGFDAVSFTYDDAGNQASKTVGTTTTSYHYDIEDRLVRVTNGSGTTIAEYVYDPFGRRLWKDVSGVRTYFFYADEGLVAEFDASGNQTKEYGYRPDSTWTTDPLFMEQDGRYYFYHHDHLGTPQQMTSVSGAVVWAAEYEEFGKATVDASSTVTNNLRFPGQYFDEETGLHYNFHRYYESTAGRYIIVDPLGMFGNTNLYLYSGANPINYMDHLGLKTCGSEWNEPIIPDNPFGFSFSDCCQEHDDCYGTCGSNKDACDTNFLECMLAACEKEDPRRISRVEQCKTYAKRYYWWVHNAGDTAYTKGQAESCACEVID